MLEEIQNAVDRLDGIANRTPVMTSRQLDEMTGAEVYLKCENFQRGGAFKFRGGYNAISQLSDSEKKTGVITHSSGNHAQAVAIAGKLLNIPTVIVMPRDAPEVKINATRGYGAEVVLCDPTQEARESTVEALIEKEGYTLIHPFDNDLIIAGAATTAVELIEEVGQLDILIGPVGGGGLISGASTYCKLSGNAEKVYAAEPFGADDAYQSLSGDIHVRKQTPNTICDGLRTTTSERTIGYIREHVDEVIRVTDEETISAVSFLFERMKLVVEPSGAVPIAALMYYKDKFRGKKIGVIISGGNLDIGPYIESLQPLD